MPTSTTKFLIPLRSKQRPQKRISRNSRLARYSKSALCLALLGLSGCAGIPIRSADGTTHHLIVGVGVVSVNQSKPNAATVTSSNGLGLTGTNQPGVRFSLGYNLQVASYVPDSAEDVRIEASRRPFGPLNVDIERADSTGKGERNETD